MPVWFRRRDTSARRRSSRRYRSGWSSATAGAGRHSTQSGVAASAPLRVVVEVTATVVMASFVPPSSAPRSRWSSCAGARWRATTGWMALYPATISGNPSEGPSRPRPTITCTVCTWTSSGSSSARAGGTLTDDGGGREPLGVWSRRRCTCSNQPPATWPNFERLLFYIFQHSRYTRANIHTHTSHTFIYIHTYPTHNYMTTDFLRIFVYDLRSTFIIFVRIIIITAAFLDLWVYVTWFFQRYFSKI